MHKSFRLRKGEIAMLCAVCFNNLSSEVREVHWASKSGAAEKRNEYIMWVGCYLDKDQQHTQTLQYVISPCAIDTQNTIILFEVESNWLLGQN